MTCVRATKVSGADVNILSKVHSIIGILGVGVRGRHWRADSSAEGRGARAGVRGRGEQPGAGIFKAWERGAARMPRLHISHAQVAQPLSPPPHDTELYLLATEPTMASDVLLVIARNIRGQYFSSLGTAGIGPDTIDERARPLVMYSRDNLQSNISHLLECLYRHPLSRIYAIYASLYSL